MENFPFYLQSDSKGAGVACLKMIVKHYNKEPEQKFRELDRWEETNPITFSAIGNIAEKIGLRSFAVNISYKDLRKKGNVPFIIKWGKDHPVVVFRIKKGKICIADPFSGILEYDWQAFLQGVGAHDKDKIDQIPVLNLEPVREKYGNDREASGKKRVGILLSYVRPYKTFWIHLMLSLLAGSAIQLLIPVLAQEVIDVGVRTKDLNFIYLILSGQFVLLIGQISGNFVRNWILLYISTRLNITLLSDFLAKLMKLPVAFFEGSLTGDIMQRIYDQQRIQNYLTGPTLNTLFSVLNFLAFTIMLGFYDIKICGIFLLFSILYIIWILYFLKKRKEVDSMRFDFYSRNHEKLVQLISGMKDIRIHNAGILKRWDWQKSQMKLFDVETKNLKVTQLQQGGAFILNQTKNILILILAASAVISGHLTMGGMLAIVYITGQLNNPIEQFINQIQTTQDAILSLNRLNDIHRLEEEDPPGREVLVHLPENKGIRIQDLSFSYPGTTEWPVLQGIDLFIPEGKVTAIVGLSGSGKTTLLKLLTKYYKPGSGIITVGGTDLEFISTETWRSNCSIVMQDNFIFSDSIANNISLGHELPDHGGLLRAAEIANIREFIESQPAGFDTIIGSGGVGISQGQKQRILIARAVYKDPQYLFLDEASSSLDVKNEKILFENLYPFVSGKTVVIVTHRLVTVEKADQIIVLDQGRIIETGGHHQLANSNGLYSRLVKNRFQLIG